MKIAIICCTPYQIFTAINLKFSKFNDEEVDLYICNHFNNSYEVAENLKKLSVFNSVFYIKDKDISSKEKNLIRFFNKFELVADRYEVNYNSVFMASYSFFNVSFYEHLYNENKNLDLYIYEDGTSTYTLPKVSTSKFWILKKLLGKKYFSFDNIKKIYLYEPKAYCCDDYIYRVEKLPEVTQDIKVKMRDVINKVFNLNNIWDYTPYNFIYFDQKFKDNSINDDTEDIFKFILDNIDSKKIVVKMHPREDISKYNEYDVSVSSDTSIPWESLLLNCDFNNKLLITVSSTSVFSSKIIFNQDNKIILLYKLVDYINKMQDYRYEKYVEAIIKEYPNVYIPNNMEELKSLLKSR